MPWWLVLVLGFWLGFSVGYFAGMIGWPLWHRNWWED